MLSYSQSGNLGDLIYSLSVVNKKGMGDFYIKLRNIPNVITHYKNGPVPPEYVDKLSDNDFQCLKPLLEVQSYINSVSVYQNQNIDVDLDEFRGVIHRTVTGNFLKAFYTTHQIPFTDEDLIKPWLTVPKPKRIAKFVIARSPRWRSSSPTTNTTWMELIENNKILDDVVFVGLPEEHIDFEKTFNIKLSYYKCKDFLDLAQVIDGCEVFLGNQTFTYGIAQGLGKNTVLETFSARALDVNECFFARQGCYYF